MQHYAPIFALALATLATPAFAQDKPPEGRSDTGFYLELEAGPTLVPDIDVDISGVPDAIPAKHDTGFDVAAALGHDFGPFRVEAEVAHKSAALDDEREAREGDESRNTRILSFMINGMFDFGAEEGSPWGGFVGGGVGVARTKAHIWQFQKFGPAFNDDSDTGFAWQLIAGLRRSLSDKVDVGIRYKFFNVGGNEVDDGVRRTSFDFRSHSLLGVITFNFGRNR